MQEGVIDNVLAGHDSLVLMPTGSGKSVWYQLPALLLDGLTLVVSPLIALMKDQVDALRAKSCNAVATAFVAGTPLGSQQKTYETVPDWLLGI